MFITDIPIDMWKRAAEKHIYEMRRAQQFTGNPVWDAEGLNIIGVRMNPVEHFYVKGKEDFNDWLILILRDRIEVFACTTDPAHVNVNPAGVAHLLAGAWDSYERGYHKQDRNRRALVQTRGAVRIIRTDQQGKVLKSESGYFGINIHNAAGWGKPSAGCTVIRPERGLMLQDKAYLRFREIIELAPGRDSRAYLLMEKPQLESYLGVKI